MPKQSPRSKLTLALKKATLLVRDLKLANLKTQRPNRTGCRQFEPYLTAGCVCTAAALAWDAIPESRGETDYESRPSAAASAGELRSGAWQNPCGRKRLSSLLVTRATNIYFKEHNHGKGTTTEKAAEAQPRKRYNHGKGAEAAIVRTFYTNVCRRIQAFRCRGVTIGRNGRIYAKQNVCPQTYTTRYKAAVLCNHEKGSRGRHQQNIQWACRSTSRPSAWSCEAWPSK